MRFMLSIHGTGNEIADALASDLECIGAELVNSSRCLCTYDLPIKTIASAGTEGADIVIYHPARNISGNYGRCWDVHKAVIEANPLQKFYVFARANPKIIDFLGERENVRYFQERNVGEIWNHLIKMAEEKRQ